MKINGIELDKSFIFSGGEVQIKLPVFHINGKENKIVVETILNTSDKIMELLLVKEAMDHYYSCYYTKLIVNYLPYARQDRRCSDGESFAGKVMIELLDNLGFSEIQIVDIHNEKLLEHFIRTKVDHIGMPDIISWNTDIIRYVDTIVSPDKGAHKKVKEIADKFNKDFISASKKRNPSSGKIEEICFDMDDVDEAILYEKLLNKNVIIIDDLVDGGGTFIGLSNIINDYMPKSLNLYATHGIFSKGLDLLFDAKIDKVYTTNSFFNWDTHCIRFPLDIRYYKSDRLTIIKI